MPCDLLALWPSLYSAALSNPHIVLWWVRSLQNEETMSHMLRMTSPLLFLLHAWSGLLNHIIHVYLFSLVSLVYASNQSHSRVWVGPLRSAMITSEALMNSAQRHLSFHPCLPSVYAPPPPASVLPNKLSVYAPPSSALPNNHNRASPRRSAL